MLGAQGEHLASDDVEEAQPVLDLEQRLGGGQAHARAQTAVEAQHDRLLQRLVLGLRIARKVLERRDVAHGLDRILRQQTGLARLELAVVVLEGMHRLRRHSLFAHLL